MITASKTIKHGWTKAANKPTENPEKLKQPYSSSIIVNHTIQVEEPNSFVLHTGYNPHVNLYTEYCRFEQQAMYNLPEQQPAYNSDEQAYMPLHW